MSTQPPSPFLTWPTGAEALVESFTELTALETAYNGTEHARVCRAFPRYGLSASFVLFDDERSSLWPFDTNAKVLIPAWMHPLPARAPGESPLVTVLHSAGVDKLFAVKRSDGSLSLRSAIVADNNPTDYPAIGGSWTTDDIEAFPVFEARLTGDSWNIEVQGPSVHTAALTFESDSVLEPIPAYNGLTSGGLPLLAEAHDWSAKPARETGFSANSFDNGHLSTFELRHAKRTVPVQFTLMSRNAALEFRLFMRQLRGRAGRFRWVAFDGIERTYRLAADTWQLKWTGSATAICSLRFVEIEE